MGKFFAGVSGFAGALTAFYTTPLDYYKHKVLDHEEYKRFAASQKANDVGDLLEGSARAETHVVKSEPIRHRPWFVALTAPVWVPALMLKGFFWDSWHDAKVFYKARSRETITTSHMADFIYSMEPLNSALIPTRPVKVGSNLNNRWGQPVPNSPYVFSAFIGSFIAWAGFGLALFTKLFDYIPGVSEVKTGAAANVFSAPLDVGLFLIDKMVGLNAYAIMPSSLNIVAFAADLATTFSVVLVTAMALTAMAMVIARGIQWWYSDDSLPVGLFEHDPEQLGKQIRTEDHQHSQSQKQQNNGMYNSGRPWLDNDQKDKTDNSNNNNNNNNNDKQDGNRNTY